MNERDMIWSGQHGVGKTKCGHFGERGFPDGTLKMCNRCPDWSNCNAISRPVYGITLTISISGNIVDEDEIDKAVTKLTKYTKKLSKNGISVNVEDTVSNYYELE